jgi:hypothetical protein
VLKRAETVVHLTPYYEVAVDPAAGRLRVTSATSGRMVLDVPLDSAVDALNGAEPGGAAVGEVRRSVVDGVTTLVIDLPSALWTHKQATLILAENHIVYRVQVRDGGTGTRILDANYFVDRAIDPGRTDMVSIYAPRFDWFEPQVVVSTDADESLAAQQWLSPPPLVYVLEAPGEYVWCAVSPLPGRYNFQGFDFTGSRGPSFRLTYEGHTLVTGSLTLPDLVIGFGADGRNKAVADAVDWQRAAGRLPQPVTKAPPHWWAEPIFCGWGQMRFDYRRDHRGHENGTFINVTSYCTELRYRNYLAALDRAGIDPGTVIIDMGWAREAGRALPDPDRWADLRGFVDEQHARGRKVLLWYSPFIAEGLPAEACMTLEGEIVAPDPTSPVYAQILQAELLTMLTAAEGGLNADGLKLDFTQCVPSEDGRFVSRVPHFGGLINETDFELMYQRLSAGRRELISTYEPLWGIELLRRSIELVHAAAKAAKPDALVMTHTANPYFADVVDVLRLNDLDGDCGDVLAVMSNRAELAAVCSPTWLIDTDDDLMVDRRRWLDYAELQPTLGIPDTYYATGIAQSLELLRPEDLERLRSIWADYRARRTSHGTQPLAG